MQHIYPGRKPSKTSSVALLFQSSLWQLAETACMDVGHQGRAVPLFDTVELNGLCLSTIDRIASAIARRPQSRSTSAVEQLQLTLCFHRSTLYPPAACVLIYTMHHVCRHASGTQGPPMHRVYVEDRLEVEDEVLKGRRCYIESDEGLVLTDVSFRKTLAR